MVLLDVGLVVLEFWTKVGRTADTGEGTGKDFGLVLVEFHNVTIFDEGP